ncbi:MAG: vWA domain-containing protein, partial [Fusobacteriaceae bacterium]
MEFANLPYFIYIIIPILIFIVALFGVRRKFRFLDMLKLVHHKVFEIKKLVFFLLGAIFIFIALLGPQKLDKERDAEIRGLDIYVIIDISNSMM